MLENWEKIFAAADILQVKLAEDVLKQNDIVSNIINKKDSTNLTPGAGFELYARKEDTERALEVLKANGFK